MMCQLARRPDGRLAFAGAGRVDNRWPEAVGGAHWAHDRASRLDSWLPIRHARARRSLHQVVARVMMINAAD